MKAITTATVGVVACVLIGAGFGLTGLVRTIPQFAAAIVVWTLGEIVMAGIGPAVAADAAPARLRGAYQGLFQAAGGAAALIAPIYGSQVMGRYGSAALWACCAAIGGLVTAGQLLLGTLQPRQEPEPEPEPGRIAAP